MSDDTDPKPTFKERLVRGLPPFDPLPPSDPKQIKREAEQERARRRARLADPNTSPLQRKIDEAHLRGPPPWWELGEPPPPQPTQTRKRKPDFVKQVKRATAAGLHVRSANVMADGVVLTFGDAEAPADTTVIETADELRKLL